MSTTVRFLEVQSNSFKRHYEKFALVLIDVSGSEIVECGIKSLSNLKFACGTVRNDQEATFC